MALPTIPASEEGVEYFVEGIGSLENTLKTGFETLALELRSIYNGVETMVDIMVDQQAAATSAALTAEVQQDDGQDGIPDNVPDGPEKKGNKFFAGLARMFASLTAAFAPLLAVPLLAIGKTVALTTAAIIGIVEVLKSIGQNTAFQEAVSNIRDLIEDKLVPLFSSLGDGIQTYIVPALQTIIGGSLKIITGAIDIAVTLFEDFSEMFINFKNGLSNLVTALFQGDIDGVLNGVSEMAMSIWDGFPKLFYNLLEGVAKLFDEAVTDSINAISQLLTGEELIGPGETFSSAIIGAITEWYNDAITSVTNAWNGLQELVKSKASEYTTSVSTFFTDIGNDFSNWITEKYQEVLNLLPELPELPDFGTIFNDFVVDLKQWFEDIIPDLPTAEEIKAKLRSILAGIGIPKIGIETRFGTIGFGPYYPFADDSEEPTAPPTTPPPSTPETQLEYPEFAMPKEVQEQVAAEREKELGYLAATGFSGDADPYLQYMGLLNNPYAPGIGVEAFGGYFSPYKFGDDVSAQDATVDYGDLDAFGGAGPDIIERTSPGDADLMDKAFNAVSESTTKLVDMFSGWIRSAEEFANRNVESAPVVINQSSSTNSSSTQLVKVDPSVKPVQFKGAAALM